MKISAERRTDVMKAAKIAAAKFVLHFCTFHYANRAGNYIMKS